MKNMPEQFSQSQPNLEKDNSPSPESNLSKAPTSESMDYMEKLGTLREKLRAEIRQEKDKEKKLRLKEKLISVLETSLSVLRQDEGWKEKAEESLNSKEKTFTSELSETIKQWQEFYQETFQITPDFSKLEIPEKREGFDKLLIIAKGMTPQKLFEKCKEFFPSNISTKDNDLDKVITSDRNTKKESYAIWVRDCIEADDQKLEDLSVDEIKKQGLVTETLEERLIQELEYFFRTKDHLDKERVNLCVGSLYVTGRVPSVRWVNDNLYVYWYSMDPSTPSDILRTLRTREAVSSAEGGK